MKALRFIIVFARDDIEASHEPDEARPNPLTLPT
jgi:hypothetical protein